LRPLGLVASDVVEQRGGQVVLGCWCRTGDRGTVALQIA
jgi:hypothetical protein